ncbi:MAG: NAD(P)-dependent oxidoreductase [Alphaproteobacteria bacterium]
MADEKLGQVGLIGLGMIGRHYAAHLLKANGQLVAFDLDPGRLGEVTRKGAESARSPKDLATRARIIVLSLPSPTAVKDALAGTDGVLSGAAPGTLIIDTSTIDPDSCVAMHRASGERDVAYVEAPLSGGEPGGAGTEGAKAANVTFMVGGDRQDYERARPVLEALGRHSFYLGPAGSGATAKLISNHIAGLINLVVAEGFVLGAAAGFSFETLLEVFQGTDARSFMMMEYIAPRLKRRDFEPGFSVDLMHKDHRLAGELGQRLHVPRLFNQLALEMYQLLRSQNRGGSDLTEAFNYLAGLANVDLYEPRNR